MKYEVHPSQEIKINSKLFPIDITKFCEWKVEVNSINVSPKSAYVAIIFIKADKEVGRRIRFISSSPGVKEYVIRSALPASLSCKLSGGKI